MICEVNLPVEALKAGSLAEAHKLAVDEAILDVVELVDVLHNFLTLFLYKVLDKRVSANGNPKFNVAVIYKSLGGEQGTEVCEGGISSDQAMHLERNGELDLDVTIVGVSYCAGILVMLGEGASP